VLGCLLSFFLFGDSGKEGRCDEPVFVEPLLNVAGLAMWARDPNETPVSAFLEQPDEWSFFPEWRDESTGSAVILRRFFPK